MLVRRVGLRRELHTYVTIRPGELTPAIVLSPVSKELPMAQPQYAWKLAAARDRWNVAVTDLAHSSGVARYSLDRIERRETMGSAETLVQIWRGFLVHLPEPAAERFSFHDLIEILDEHGQPFPLPAPQTPLRTDPPSGAALLPRQPRCYWASAPLREEIGRSQRVEAYTAGRMADELGIHPGSLSRLEGSIQRTDGEGANYTVSRVTNFWPDISTVASMYRLASRSVERPITMHDALVCARE